jgi:hypothetical protein
VKRQDDSTSVCTCIPVSTGLNLNLVRFVCERQDNADARTIFNANENSTSWRNNTMMPHERRLSARKTPEHFAYLSLPSNNGGVVVDVSEGGLGFRAIAPVELDGPIHFRFAIDSSVRIRAVGELAWKDETGKTGGLRFTELSDEVREQIRVWSGRSNPGADGAAERADASVLNVPVGEPAVAAEAAAAGWRRPDPAAVADTPAAEPKIDAELALSGKADSTPAEATGNPALYNLKPPVYSAPFKRLSMFSQEVDSEAAANAVVAPNSVVIPEPVVMRHPVAAIGVTIVLAFLVSMGIFAYASTSQTGRFLLDWGEEMWEGSSSQPIPQDAAPPAHPAPDSSNTLQR